MTGSLTREPDINPTWRSLQWRHIYAACSAWWISPPHPGGSNEGYHLALHAKDFMEDSHCHFISLSTVHVYFVLEPWSRQSCDRNGMILAGAVAYRDKASPAALAFEHQFRVPLLLYPSNSLLIALKQQQKMDHDLGSMHPHGRPG